MSLKATTNTTAGAYRRGRRIGAAASLIAVAALALTACGSKGGSDNASSGSSSASASSSSGSGISAGAQDLSGKSTEPSASPTQNPGSAPSAAPSNASAASSSAPVQSASDICKANHLSLKLAYGDAAAGNIYENLVFTNKGNTACTLTGYPGVSLINGDGSQIGTPATRDSSSIKPRTIRLAPGNSAHAVLHTANQGVSDKPCWKKPAYVKVYAPDSKTMMTAIDKNFQVCGDLFTVSPVEAGAY